MKKTNPQITSDNHVEIIPIGCVDHVLKKITQAKGVVVIAGDYCVPANFNFSHESFDAILPKCEIVYVSGNHEYYGSSKQKVDEFLTQHEIWNPKFHYLNNSSCVVGGVKYIGGCGWSSINEDVGGRISDFSRIQGFTPNDCTIEFRKFKEFMIEELSVESKFPVVCVTHFLPHSGLIDDAYKGDSLNQYFCNNLVETLAYYDNVHIPKYFVYGHSHSKNKMNVIDGVVYAANQYGYYSYDEKFGKQAKLLKLNVFGEKK